MAPTIVFDHGRPAVALGSPGGATIITTVLQMLVNHIDFGHEPARRGGGAAGVAAQQRVDAGRAGVHRGYGRPPVPGEASAGTLFSHAERPGRSARSTGIRFLPGGRQQAVAEPTRRGGGSAMVVHR